MANRKPRRFRTAGDTGVSVYIPGRPEPVRIEGSGTYTTDDKDEIEVLKGTPELVEVKIPERKSDG